MAYSGTKKLNGLVLEEQRGGHYTLVTPFELLHFLVLTNRIQIELNGLLTFHKHKMHSGVKVQNTFCDTNNKYDNNLLDAYVFTPFVEPAFAAITAACIWGLSPPALNI